MRNYKTIIPNVRIARLLVFALLLVFCGQGISWGQNLKDSTKVSNLLVQASKKIADNNTAEGRELAFEGSELAKKIKHTSLRAQASEVIGDSYSKELNYDNSLKFYLAALFYYQSFYNQRSIGHVQAKIGSQFLQQHVYSKAIEYYENAYQNSLKSLDEELEKRSVKSLALLYDLTAADDKALEVYRKLLIKQDLSKIQRVEYLLAMARLYERKLDFVTGIEKTDEALAELGASSKDPLFVMAMVEKAFLQKKMDKPMDAISTYDALVKSAAFLHIPESDQAKVWVSRGVVETGLNDFSSAKSDYSRALQTWTKLNNVRESANTMNYIAGNYYISGNHSRAKEYAQKAIDLLQAKPENDILANSYEILALCEESKSLNEKYLGLSENYKQLAEADLKAAKIKNLNTRLEMDRMENDIREELGQQQKIEAYMETTKFDAERKERDLELKEKELSILRKNQQLRESEIRNKELEQQRTAQLLEITRAKAVADELKRGKEIQDLQLAKQETEKKDREQTITILEKEKTLQNLQLKQEANFKKYAILILILIVLILIGVFQAWRNTKRHENALKTKNAEIIEKNTEVEAQKKEVQAAHDEIVVQNEEMYQYQQEIMVQRDNATVQNKMLEKQNRKINQSISSAQVIQAAILPTAEKIFARMGEYLLFFMPRDVVSGDLYWVSRVQGIRIVAVIDCTGHGVPGALMSLIANNLVNRIIKIENTYDPGEILTLLHKLVYRELKQETSGNSDGMDVALVAISNLETGKFSVAYAGAKRPMHYVLPDGNFIVNEIEPDKMSIGGHYKKERLFSTKTIELEAGTRIYLATDGFIDQNDPERKRFGQRRFKELLAIAAQKSFSEQYKIFEKAYEEHRGNSEQRDDILVMGIEL